MSTVLTTEGTSASVAQDAVIDLRSRTPTDGPRLSLATREHITSKAIRLPRPATEPETTLRRALAMTLDGLDRYSGRGWQDRWVSSGCSDDPLAWRERLAPPGRASVQDSNDASVGMGCLFLLDAVRPSLSWLVERKGMTRALRAVVDLRAPEFAASVRLAVPATETRSAVLFNVARILLHYGYPSLDQICGDDVVSLRDAAESARTLGLKSPAGRWGITWQMLVKFGPLPEHSIIPNLKVKGHLSIEQLVDRRNIKAAAVRDVIIRYLQQREPTVDYNTLTSLADLLTRDFWVDIERHSPGIETLHLPKNVATQWKDRVRTRLQPGSAFNVLSGVRAFYLDISQLAHEDPSWVQLSAPSPISRDDLKGNQKAARTVRARLHQRVREALPQMDRLLASTQAERSRWQALHGAASACPPGGQFTFEGCIYTRPAGSRARTTQQIWARSASGETINISRHEERAFWRWAIVNTLYYTGVRKEELLEITALALNLYTLPGTAQRVPILQIIPSKTDEERILLVEPELAHTLAMVKSRVSDENTGAVPLIGRYDIHERTYSPPLPFLFQHMVAGVPKAISMKLVDELVGEAIGIAGITDATGQPVKLSPHDFRRMFLTEAVSSGLPVHIVAKLAGHKNISTTQGYLAIYQQDVIRHFQKFIVSRRKLRPREEYRDPSEAELAEFEQHFLRRKVELGTCSRAYGTACQHEHACIRCAMLRPDPAQRPRLEEILANLKDRATEAAEKGWLGEIEGIEISIAAAEQKLSRMSTIVNLPMPGVVQSKR